MRERRLGRRRHQSDMTTMFIQGFQTMMQKRLLAPALASTQTTLQVPGFVRWRVRMPILRDLPPRLIGFGIQRARVEG